MIVCTTMVLFILVETTCPILVLRVPVRCALVVSAIYFFLFFALAIVLFAVLPLPALFLAVLPAAECFVAVAGAAASALAPLPAAVLAASGAAIPSSFSRITVWMRATFLRRPRILFRLSVCPILS